VIGISAFVILLFAAGHLIRDGWPPLGTTHGARIIGAAVCGLGAALVAESLTAAITAGAVLAGFYFDRRHAEGQKAQTPADTDFLMLSGLTSVAPVVLLAPLAILAGAAKPLVWRAAWAVVPESRWLSPTRVAAMTFGALIGLALALTA
jgi:hypothetical protein